jgi:hypothetical protein
MTIRTVERSDGLGTYQVDDNDGKIIVKTASSFTLHDSPAPDGFVHVAGKDGVIFDVPTEKLAEIIQQK